MAEQERFSASLDKDLKKKLEEVGEKNFRKLNGELNAAVAFYLKHAVTTVAFVENKEEVAPATIEQPSITPSNQVHPVAKTPLVQATESGDVDEIKPLNTSGVKSRRL